MGWKEIAVAVLVMVGCLFMSITAYADEAIDYSEEGPAYSYAVDAPVDAALDLFMVRADLSQDENGEAYGTPYGDDGEVTDGMTAERPDSYAWPLWCSNARQDTYTEDESEHMNAAMDAAHTEAETITRGC